MLGEGGVDPSNLQPNKMVDLWIKLTIPKVTISGKEALFTFFRKGQMLNSMSN